ncbi:putative transposable element [Phytophthora palmivora]|uniref:Transposable element n=1 Tax=Phytophthora palmivora TaxID=4796 RepID=A0A2P4XN82_9STRA|nr:putative transposable element [Phytophthora palmivora]
MDVGVYVRTVRANKVFMTVDVDDLLIVGTKTDIEHVLIELKSEFKVKDLDTVEHLLGMEIAYVPGRMLTISQKSYCENVLKRFKMDKCKPVPTPQVKGILPRSGDSAVEQVCVSADPDLNYRQFVVFGAVLTPRYCKRCKNIGKYLSCFTHEHLILPKGMLRYLRGTTDYGLVWARSDKPDLRVAAFVDAWRVPKEDVHLVAHADADLGNEKQNRRSVTGFVLQLEGCTFAYSSRKQRIKTDDTCSSEFVAATECSTMILWTHNICKELGVRRKETVFSGTGDDQVCKLAVKCGLITVADVAALTAEF